MIIHCLLLHHHHRVCCCGCNACNFLIAGFDFGFDENLICNQDRAQITVHKNCFLKGKQQCASCRSTFALPSSATSSAATATATTTAAAAATHHSTVSSNKHHHRHRHRQRHRQSKCASLHSMTAITLLICCCQYCCCCCCCMCAGVHSYCLLMRTNTHTQLSSKQLLSGMQGQLHSKLVMAGRQQQQLSINQTYRTAI